MFERHLLAQRLGFRSWSEVEDYPHVEVALMLDILSIEIEAASSPVKRWG